MSIWQIVEVLVGLQLVISILVVGISFGAYWIRHSWLPGVGRALTVVSDVHPTDVIIGVLSTLRRVNPELDRIEREVNIIDSVKNQKLANDLQLIRELLNRLQQPFK